MNNAESRGGVSSRVYAPAGNDIVVILFDQLSAKWLEKAGELGLTPNVDRLRTMGTVFPNAFSGTPICMPARSSMATGMTVRQHGVLTNGYVLNHELPTHMSILKNHGYRTGGFGKFHFRPEIAIEDFDHRLYGFDVAEKSEDWDKWHRGGFLEENRLERPGYFFSVKEEKKTQTAWITRRGTAFLLQPDRDRPLYACISYVEPHPPYAPPAGYAEKIDPGSLPEAIMPAWREDTKIPLDLFNSRTGWTPYFHYDDEVRTDPVKFWLKARRYYFADILHLDEQVGKILDAIQETGRLDKTFVLLTADHGDLLGDHGFCEKGWAHYDACIRVPMIVAGPNLRKGQVRQEIVQLEDVFHTILDMGGDLPGRTTYTEPTKEIGLYWTEEPRSTIGNDAPEQLAGMPRSLLPLCRGEAAEGWRTSAYIESYEGAFGRWTRTVRNERFRYTYFPGGGEQLFDLSEDPREIVNLAGNPAHGQARQGLKDELLERSFAQDYPRTLRDRRNPRMY